MLKNKGESIKNSSLSLLALSLSAASQVIVQIVIAYLYGAGIETDAFFVAFIIPLLLFWAIQNSSKISIVPMFTEILDNEGKETLWQVAGVLLTVSTFFLIIFATIASFLSPYIISIIAPGLDTKTSLIAANIFRILSFIVVFAGIIAIWVSIQNIFSRFFVPAMNNFERTVFVIIVTVIFYKSLGIYAVAMGFLMGGVIQCLVLLPGLWKEGYRYRYHFSINDSNVRLFFGLTFLPFLSLIIRQGNTVVDRILASFLSTGSISALSYSYTIANGFILIVSGGLFAVSLPEFSRYAVRKKINEMKDALILNLKVASIITFPLTVLLILLGRPIIRLIYERGAFDSTATELTSSLLSYYAIGIFFLSVVPVMLGVFYAFKDTVTPFIHLLIVFFTNIVLAFVLMKLMGIRGLALALSLAGIFSFVRISYIIKKKIGHVFDRTLFLFWFKTLVSTIVMGIGIWFFIGWFSKEVSYISLIGNIKLVILSLCIGFAVFSISAYILKLEGRKFIVRKVYSTLTHLGEISK